MAIIEEVPGLEARVLVDGVPLEEYREPADTNDDTQNKVTRYIVAEPGKEFTVQVRRTPQLKQGAPDWDLAIWVKIDGKVAKSLFFKKHEGLNVVRLFDAVDADQGKGRWTKKNFMFSDLVFDNNEAPPRSINEVERVKHLGEIEVILKRGWIGEELDSSQAAGQGFTITGKVHEKALKGRAISRQASLGKARPANPPKVLEFHAEDSIPFAKFRFRYRSLRDLKAEMIIPRSPTPVPLEDRLVEELTPDEMRELLRRQRANGTQARPRIKRERQTADYDDGDGNNDDGGDSDGIEIVDPPPKRQRIVETVDLTSD